jgi:hypothetical protein
MAPGIWESRLEVKVHTSAECKTGISTVLTITSGLDPHTMRNWTHVDFGDGNMVEVATSCSGEMAIPCSLGLLPHVT